MRPNRLQRYDGRIRNEHPLREPQNIQWNKNKSPIHNQIEQMRPGTRKPINVFWRMMNTMELPHEWHLVGRKMTEVLKQIGNNQSE